MNDKEIWHKAHLVHEELMNMEFEHDDILIFIDCLKKIENSLE